MTEIPDLPEDIVDRISDLRLRETDSPSDQEGI